MWRIDLARPAAGDRSFHWVDERTTRILGEVVSTASIFQNVYSLKKALVGVEGAIYSEGVYDETGWRQVDTRPDRREYFSRHVVPILAEVSHHFDIYGYALVELVKSDGLLIPQVVDQLDYEVGMLKEHGKQTRYACRFKGKGFGVQKTEYATNRRHMLFFGATGPPLKLREGGIRFNSVGNQVRDVVLESLIRRANDLTADTLRSNPKTLVSSEVNAEANALKRAQESSLKELFDRLRADQRVTGEMTSFVSDVGEILGSEKSIPDLFNTIATISNKYDMPLGSVVELALIQRASSGELTDSDMVKSLGANMRSLQQTTAQLHDQHIEMLNLHRQEIAAAFGLARTAVDRNSATRTVAATRAEEQRMYTAVKMNQRVVQDTAEHLLKRIFWGEDFESTLLSVVGGMDDEATAAFSSGDERAVLGARQIAEWRTPYPSVTMPAVVAGSMGDLITAVDNGLNIDPHSRNYLLALYAGLPEDVLERAKEEAAGSKSKTDP